MAPHVDYPDHYQFPPFPLSIYLSIYSQLYFFPFFRLI